MFIIIIIIINIINYLLGFVGLNGSGALFDGNTKFIGLFTIGSPVFTDLNSAIHCCYLAKSTFPQISLTRTRA